MDLTAIEPLSLPSLSFSAKAELPECLAVYFVMDGDRVLYIGKTVNLHSRWVTHHRLKQFKKMTVHLRIAWLECGDPTLLLEIEKALIRHFNPTLHRTSVPDQAPKINAYINREINKASILRWLKSGDLNLR